MGDNDAAMRDIAAEQVQLSALKSGNGQNYIPPVTGVGDLFTIVAACAQVPDHASMAITRYLYAVRLPTQSCQSSAAVFIMQTSASLKQVKRYAIAVEELKVGQAKQEKNILSFQQQVEKESRKFRSYVENRFDHLEALIMNWHQYEPVKEDELVKY